MADSQIAIIDAGGFKQLIATDEVAGVHTLKVTTVAPTSSVLISTFGNNYVKIGTVETAGVHTICAQEA